MIQFERTVEVRAVLEGLRSGRPRVERRRRPRPLRCYLHLVEDCGEQDANRFEILSGAKDLLRRYIVWRLAAYA